jgi:hypothetical protein
MNINPQDIRTSEQRATAARRLERANDLRGDAWAMLNDFIEAVDGGRDYDVVVSFADLVVLREGLLAAQVATDNFYDLWRATR